MGTGDAWFPRTWARVLLVPRGAERIDGWRSASITHRRRDHWSLYRLTAGCITLDDGRCVRSCRAPCRWLTSPHTAFRHQCDDGPVAGMVAEFNAMPAPGWEHPLHRLPPLAMAAGGGDAAAWDALMAISDEAKRGDAWAALAARPHLDRILFDTLRDLLPTALPSVRPAWLDELLIWISQRSNTDLRLAQVARAAGFSSSHLCRAFHQHLGVTVGAFIREQRLAQAARLLRERPDQSVAEIALRGRWSTPQLFIRHFRKRFGTTPGMWRRIGAIDESPDGG